MDKLKIYVAGHTGMVGSAILRQLKHSGYNNLIYRTHKELDLTEQEKVLDFLLTERPDYIFLAAAKVGGIQANNHYRADFIYQNLMLQTNVINAAWKAGIKRLMFLGSGCIYPRDCLQPICEDYLLTGKLEFTNEPYAIAKIAGIKLCESYNQQYKTQYISIIPTSLYGINDNYNLDNCHVLPALIRKCHEAMLKNNKDIVVWGSGRPLREFLYVDDLAEACVFLMEKDIPYDMINIGSGQEVSIFELLETIKSVVGFNGNIIFDSTKPDGTPRKLLNTDKMNQFGWRAKTGLYEGITKTYQNFLACQDNDN